MACLFFLITIGGALAQPPLELVSVNHKIQHLLKVPPEKLGRNMVQELTHNVIANRQHFSNDILAKVYLLSARSSSLQGDMTQVRYFSEQGLLVNSLDKNIKLLLTLKKAEVWLAEKSYHALLEACNEAVKYSELNHNKTYRLQALSYRSIAYSLLNKYKLAIEDLTQVIDDSSKIAISENYHLHHLIALSHFYLGDYQAALKIEQQILRFKFQNDLKESIAQSYISLGYINLYLQRMDEASHAFWQAADYAKKQNSNINEAYAKKGLAIINISQQEFIEAITPLTQAIKTFQDYKLRNEKIESLVALASAKAGLGEVSESNQLLREILILLKGKDISIEYSGFYRMLAEMYAQDQAYLHAYQWQQRYSEILLKKLLNKKRIQGFSQLITREQPLTSVLYNQKTAQVKSFEKLNHQVPQATEAKAASNLIFYSVISLLMGLLMLTSWKLRRLTSKVAHITKSEIKIDFDESPIKLEYHQLFKKSQTYHYPFTVAHLVVENWQEITFYFNENIIEEVMTELEVLINDHLSEYDQVGGINNDAFLLLLEHQFIEDASVKLEQLVGVINNRSFSCLGTYTIKVNYSLNSPKLADTDSHLFLAKLIEPEK